MCDVTRCATKQTAFGTILALYSLGAFAQANTPPPENKQTPAATLPFPPSCSFQTPCIENPVTGQRYQVDAAGTMTTID